MANKLRELFGLDPIYNEKIDRQIRDMKLSLIHDHHCSYCLHGKAGINGGTQCEIMNELMVGYECGSQCLFWQISEEGRILEYGSKEN